MYFVPFETNEALSEGIPNKKATKRKLEVRESRIKHDAKMSSLWLS